MTSYRTILKHIDNPNWKFPFPFTRPERVSSLVGRFLGFKYSSTMIYYLQNGIPTEETLLSCNKYFYGVQTTNSWLELAQDTKHDLTLLLDTEKKELVPSTVTSVQIVLGECGEFIDFLTGKKIDFPEKPNSSRLHE